MITDIAYTLTLRARVSAGRSGEVQNSRRIHEILPGATVRGALGSGWWTSPTDRYAGTGGQAVFDDLFARNMRVGPAMPTLPTPATLEPNSWATCKYPEPGCPPGWHDEVRDHLTGEAGDSRCPGCSRPYRHGKGWSVPSDGLTETTRTALRADGVARDEQLFTRRALEHLVATPDGRWAQTLTGLLRFTTTPPDDVEAWLLAPKTLRVGGQLSTMGECAWTAQRVARAPVPQARDIAVRLTSDTILVDEYGAPTLDLAGAARDVIAAAGGRGDVAPVGWTRPVVLTGWHGLAGVAKPSEWAVAAGSVVLVRDCDGVAAAALADGIGLRRAEGYGMTVLVPVPDTVTFGDRGADPHAAAIEATPPVAVVPTATELLTPPSAPSAPAVHEEPVVEEVDPTLTSVERLIAGIAGADLRDTIERGILAQARNVRRYRDRGFPTSVIDGQIENIRSLPWMKRLSGGLQDEVVALLRAEDLDVTEQVLAFRTGMTR